MNWYEKMMMEIEAGRNSDPQGCAIPACLVVAVLTIVAFLL